ncbi:aldehyde oxidase 5 isoform X1 [Acipenser ruthenus]|uniref:aldehyde oxidase 5 isoform X1 n=1 Tax=Acipenser ruthenus TaxID=7906 RepID=UPI00145A9AEE|nr:aldehyde oxidase 5 isoform X1 [Acipenser ruthenus]
MTCKDQSDELIFFINGRKIVEKNADPEVMLLTYLRKKVRLTGVKYGCGGGGCGACTVMISRYDTLQSRVLHFSVNACLLPIVSLHGVAVTTVEGVGSTKTKLHPVQERIAKAHGSQCGFCTPGMVMSMYTLLRNIPEPSIEDIREALTGNLCRCTGYRPIIDGFKTFCGASKCCQNGNDTKNCCLDQEPELNQEDDEISSELFKTDDFLPLDPTQDLIFPPELMLLARQQGSGRLVFQGERLCWISPGNLAELLELKAQHPSTPLVIGNTTVGPNMKLKGVSHPLIIAPAGIVELSVVKNLEDGISFGAGCSLSVMKDELKRVVSELSEEKVEVYQALLQTLSCLAGKQIRNMATLGGNILSANPKYDLNSILSAGGCTLTLASKGGLREIHLNEEFFTGFEKTAIRPDEVLLSVYVPHSRQWEFMLAFRQAQRREFSFSIVNSGMKVVFKEGTNVVDDIRMFFGGVGPTMVRTKHMCQELVGRPWNEELLTEACRLLLDEIPLQASAHGGMVEFKKTLTLSFLFKFYLHVLQRLREKGLCVDELPSEYLSALKSFRNEVPQGQHRYQVVSAAQFSDDPIGRPYLHQSAFKQATGEAVYYDDLPSIEGELFLVPVTSSRPHAKIISIDAAAALSMPGVAAFLSAPDVPGNNRRSWFGDIEELFVEEEVTCVGQIIGAIVADTRENARRAVECVKVTYEDLTPVLFTIEEAIEQQSFYNPQRKLERGSVDGAWESVDHIFEGEIYMGGQEHFYMETQGLIAVPKGEDGEMELFAATQHAAFTQEVVATTLGVEANKITCHVKRLGGGFGGKVMKIASLSAIAAIAAHKTGRSVRLVLDRGDDMLITGGRHPFLGRYKVGFMKDGTIVAADIIYYSNGGNTLDESLFIMEKALLHMDNGYRIPHLRGRGFVCRTNLPSNTAFRGFGGPQGLMVIESVLHEVAAKCGIPTERVRDMNMCREVSLTHHKQLFDPGDMVRCWEQCLQQACVENRRLAIQEFNKNNRWRKRGLCTVPLKFGVGFSKGFHNQGAALLHIYKDGSVLLTHGGTEMGQGINTKAIQVASRILKIPMSSIHITETCTGNVPNAAPSAASFGTDAVGMAVKDACEKIMKRLKPIMQENPKDTWAAWIKEAYCQKVSLSATGFFMGPHTNVDWEKGEGMPYYYFTFGACCSEVEVDCLTGDHKNIRTDIVMDVGQSLNPALDIGQIEGGFVQGLGLYTIEELQFSPEGVLRTRGPSQYKVPALCDVPAQLNVSLLANAHNPHAIYFSKGIGEPTVFFGCTLFYAIKEAIAAARKDSGLSGSFPLSSPATPEKIRLACVDRFTQMVPAVEPGSFTPWTIGV